LACAGADVAIAAITLEPVAETAAAIRALGHKIVALQVNVMEYEQVRSMVQGAAASGAPATTQDQGVRRFYGGTDR
jgi:predicted dinucleotide-binding enzyme